jgi:hypothetical protein
MLDVVGYNLAHLALIENRFSHVLVTSLRVIGMRAPRFRIATSGEFLRARALEQTSFAAQAEANA